MCNVDLCVGSVYRKCCSQGKNYYVRTRPDPDVVLITHTQYLSGAAAHGRIRLVTESWTRQCQLLSDPPKPFQTMPAPLRPI